MKEFCVIQLKYIIEQYRCYITDNVSPRLIAAGGGFYLNSPPTKALPTGVL